MPHWNRHLCHTETFIILCHTETDTYATLKETFMPHWNKHLCHIETHLRHTETDIYATLKHIYAKLKQTFMPHWNAFMPQDKTGTYALHWNRHLRHALQRHLCHLLKQIFTPHTKETFMQHTETFMPIALCWMDRVHSDHAKFTEHTETFMPIALCWMDRVHSDHTKFTEHFNELNTSTEHVFCSIFIFRNERLRCAGFSFPQENTTLWNGIVACEVLRAFMNSVFVRNKMTLPSPPQNPLHKDWPNIRPKLIDLLTPHTNWPIMWHYTMITDQWDGCQKTHSHHPGPSVWGRDCWVVWRWQIPGWQSASPKSGGLWRTGRHR